MAKVTEGERKIFLEVTAKGWFYIKCLNCGEIITKDKGKCDCDNPKFVMIYPNDVTYNENSGLYITRVKRYKESDNG